MAQWWERSPPKKLISVQCHLWAEFVVSFSLARRVFLRVLRFSFFHKNQRTKFQFHQNRGPTWKPAEAEVVSTLCYSFMIMIGVRLGRFIFLCMWSVWNQSVLPFSCRINHVMATTERACESAWESSAHNVESVRTWHAWRASALPHPLKQRESTQTMTSDSQLPNHLTAVDERKAYKVVVVKVMQFDARVDLVYARKDPF